MGISATEDICPNCGKFVVSLNERTGFCTNCSSDRDRSDGRCMACGASADSTHKFCWNCRTEQWLTKHINDIERYMGFGRNLDEAKLLVRRDNETLLNCWSCGEEMRAAANGHNFFCTKTVRCRTAHRRLKYLMYDRPRLPKQTALEKVMEELK